MKKNILILSLIIIFAIIIYVLYKNYYNTPQEQGILKEPIKPVYDWLLETQPKKDIEFKSENIKSENLDLWSFK